MNCVTKVLSNNEPTEAEVKKFKEHYDALPEEDKEEIRELYHSLGEKIRNSYLLDKIDEKTEIPN